jgi:hypothetical protein
VAKIRHSFPVEPIPSRVATHVEQPRQFTCVGYLRSLHAGIESTDEVIAANFAGDALPCRVRQKFGCDLREPEINFICWTGRDFPAE